MWDVEEGEMVHVEELLGGGRHSSEVKVVYLLWELVKRYEPQVVVIEDFILRGVAGSTRREALSPARIGFGIACVLGIDSGVEVVLSDPSAAISVFTNERLKRLGMYVKFPGGGEHVRDAARHVAMYLRKSR